MFNPSTHPRTVRWLASPGETLKPLTQKAFIAQQWNMRAQEWDKAPIQQLHTLIPLVGNLWHSWGNFTYNHFPLIYIYPICILCIYPCSDISPSLLPLYTFLLVLPRVLVLFLLCLRKSGYESELCPLLHLTLWKVLLELPFPYLSKYENEKCILHYWDLVLWICKRTTIVFFFSSA